MISALENEAADSGLLASQPASFAPPPFEPSVWTPAFLIPSSDSVFMTPSVLSAFATAQGGLSFEATPGALVELIVDNRYIMTLGSSVSGWDAKNVGLFNGGETVILRPVTDGQYGGDYTLVVNGAAQSIPSSTAMSVTVAPQQSDGNSLSPVPLSGLVPSSKPGVRSLSPLLVVAAAAVLYMMLD